MPYSRYSQKRRLTRNGEFGYYAFKLGYVKVLMSTLRLTAIFLLLSLAGCSSTPQLAFPGVYRIDIPQGNIVTQEMVDQLRPGLTKQQVNFIMGTPLVRDTFHQNRWDYLYSFQPGGGVRVQEVLSLFFQNNELVRFEGDFQQSPEIASFDNQPQQQPGAGREVSSR